MKNSSKIVISIFTKLVALAFLNILSLLFLQGDGYRISDRFSGNVTLDKKQSALAYYYMPKKISYLKHFSDATAGKCFNKISKEGNKLIIKDLHLHSVYITARVNNDEKIYWDIYSDRQNTSESSFVLKEVKPNNPFTLASYVFYHSWKFLFHSLVFIFMAWFIDKKIGQRFKVIDYILLVLNVFVLYLMFLS